MRKQRSFFNGRTPSVLLPIGLALLLSACVDEISFDIPKREQKKLAIVGQITRGNPSVASASISRTSDFSPGATPAPVEGAEVGIEDEKGNLLFLRPLGNGSYQETIDPGSGISINIGDAYRLRVETPDGASYSSDWETLRDVPRAERLHFSLITRQVLNEVNNLVDQNYIQFSVSSPLLPPGSEDPAFLKWDFEGCYQLRETPPSGPGNARTCYIKEPLNLANVVIVDGNNAGSTELEQFLLFEDILDSRFADGYYLTAYQKSLSPGAFRYCDQGRQASLRQGGLCEAPDGPIRSNIRNDDNPDEQVLGYFSAESADTVRLFINFRNDPDNRPKGICEPPVYEVQDFCRNCLLRERSSLEKPDYWIE